MKDDGRQRITDLAAVLDIDARDIRQIVAAYIDEVARDFSREASRLRVLAITIDAQALDLSEQASALRMDYDGDDVDRLGRAAAAVLAEKAGAR
jgi:hypothetical protein